MCSQLIEQAMQKGSDSVVTVWDATYEYIPKSSNFRYQAATYSKHKSRNLVKPMVSVTPDGLILDVFGPNTLWKASMSDGDILSRIMDLPDFRERFKRGDVFVVDRGFRSVKQKLEDAGYVVKIPPHLEGRRTQLTAVQANQQRNCTAVRWIVEAINRQLKCNRYLARTNCVQAVPHLLDDTRIAAAIHNKYGTRVYAYSDDGIIASRIQTRQNIPNRLQTMIESGRLTRQRTVFNAMDGNLIPEFPEIDPVSMRNLMGSYHIALALSYYGDHVSEETGYGIEIGRELTFTAANFRAHGIEVNQPLFIRIRLTSRHSRSKIYQAYLLCDLSRTSIDSIIEFYCQCLQGCRTVSPCAHVASVIWFLGYGRSLDSIRTPSEFLNNHLPAGIMDESEDENQD